tara:strand:- start:40 stop:357 length:318 start_codon:yes stop_codon:yes gene_type:complete
MKKENYSTGATRNDLGGIRYDLLYFDFIKEMAEVMGEGAKSHGSRNWEQGMPEGTCMNHLMNHLQQYLDGDRSEPHLAKVAVNAMFMQFYDDRGIHIEEEDNENG